jgi:NMD protein affecting ribosome stability and mRNA decay
MANFGVPVARSDSVRVEDLKADDKVRNRKETWYVVEIRSGGVKLRNLETDRPLFISNGDFNNAGFVRE